MVPESIIVDKSWVSQWDTNIDHIDFIIRYLRDFGGVT
jgi:hypothetical protein